MGIFPLEEANEIHKQTCTNMIMPRLAEEQKKPEQWWSFSDCARFRSLLSRMGNFFCNVGNAVPPLITLASTSSIVAGCVLFSVFTLNRIHGIVRVVLVNKFLLINLIAQLKKFIFIDFDFESEAGNFRWGWGFVSCRSTNCCEKSVMCACVWLWQGSTWRVGLILLYFCSYPAHF